MRSRLTTLPEVERHYCEMRILRSLARAVEGFADLIEVLHELSLDVQVGALPLIAAHETPGADSSARS